ncbi:MAG: YggU family protein [Nitrospiraceae bacterium]|nr:YggU family protein [Nitrospiraceae bacterium]
MRDTAQGVLLSVHVQPRASSTGCVGLHGDAVKIRVAAPPSDGAANDELRRFLAQRCRVPLGAVELVAGAGSRQKRLMIRGVTAEQLRDLLLES